MSFKMCSINEEKIVFMSYLHIIKEITTYIMNDAGFYLLKVKQVVNLI